MADFVNIDSLTLEDSNMEPADTKPEGPTKPDMDFIKMHPFIKQTVLDKVYGCIIGSALGDSIGLYTEFLPKQACETFYKERKFSLLEPITEFYPDSHRNRFERRAWTDDTDQALLIILSYLRSHATSDQAAHLAQDFAARLQIWIEQGLRALDRPPCGIGALVGSVVSNPDYLKDPADTATKRWIKTQRHVAPNGSVMRTHPIGVMGIGISEEETWILATAVGRTTHVDPRCTVSCCISVGLVRGIIRGEISSEEDVDAAIERAYEWVLSQPELMNPGLDSELTQWEIKRHLERKEFERHLYAKNYEDLKLDSQREMGYVYKCIGSAVLTLRYAIRSTRKDSVSAYGTFEKLMIDLIMEGGDSDTNGAVAGAFLGSLLGFSSLPSHWSDGLAHRGWLIEKIGRLTKVLGIVQGPVDPEADEAPDGGKGLMNREQLEKRDRDMLHTILLRDKERKEKDERKKNQGKGLSGWFKK